MTRKRSSPMGLEVVVSITLALALLPLIAKAAPLQDYSEVQQYSDGCYYNYNHYGEGDRIITNEPCLNCTCHNRMLMCYLRVCPFTKPIGHDCIVEKREDQCCPIITCPEVPVDVAHHAPEPGTELSIPEKFGCSIDEKFYPEGAQVPSNPSKPCELCYCIKNRTSCLMQECTLHIDGCTPIYNKGSCCPVRYNCDHENDILGLEDHSTSTTTTVRPTPGFILTTMAPAVSTDCNHNGERYADGASVPGNSPCQHCYCMRGDIVCAVQECEMPMVTGEGKSCKALAPAEGECCPSNYICDDDSTTKPYDADDDSLALTTPTSIKEAPSIDFTTLSPDTVADISVTATPKPEESGGTTLSSDIDEKDLISTTPSAIVDHHVSVSQEDLDLQTHIDDKDKDQTIPIISQDDRATAVDSDELGSGEMEPDTATESAEDSLETTTKFSSLAPITESSVADKVDEETLTATTQITPLKEGSEKATIPTIPIEDKLLEEEDSKSTEQTLAADEITVTPSAVDQRFDQSSEDSKEEEEEKDHVTMIPTHKPDEEDVSTETIATSKPFVGIDLTTKRPATDEEEEFTKATGFTESTVSSESEERASTSIPIVSPAGSEDGEVTTVPSISSIKLDSSPDSQETVAIPSTTISSFTKDETFETQTESSGDDSLDKESPKTPKAEIDGKERITTAKPAEDSSIFDIVSLDESTTLSSLEESDVDSTTLESLAEKASVAPTDSATTAIPSEDIHLSTIAPHYIPPRKDEPEDQQTATTMQPIVEDILTPDKMPEMHLPSSIPGEGDCLFGMQTYANNSIVPSTSICEISCKCISSIVVCEKVKCDTPENVENCILVENSEPSCCPTYVCAPTPTSSEEQEVTQTPTLDESSEEISQDMVPTEVSIPSASSVEPMSHVKSDESATDQSILDTEPPSHIQKIEPFTSGKTTEKPAEDKLDTSTETVTSSDQEAIDVQSTTIPSLVGEKKHPDTAAVDMVTMVPSADDEKQTPYDIDMTTFTPSAEKVKESPELGSTPVPVEDKQPELGVETATDMGIISTAAIEEEPIKSVSDSEVSGTTLKPTIEEDKQSSIELGTTVPTIETDQRTDSVVDLTTGKVPVEEDEKDEKETDLDRSTVLPSIEEKEQPEIDISVTATTQRPVSGIETDTIAPSVDEEELTGLEPSAAETTVSPSALGERQPEIDTDKTTLAPLEDAEKPAPTKLDSEEEAAVTISPSEEEKIPSEVEAGLLTTISPIEQDKQAESKLPEDESTVTPSVEEEKQPEPTDEEIQPQTEVSDVASTTEPSLDAAKQAETETKATSLEAEKQTKSEVSPVLTTIAPSLEAEKEPESILDMTTRGPSADEDKLPEPAISEAGTTVAPSEELQKESTATAAPSEEEDLQSETELPVTPSVGEEQQTESPTESGIDMATIVPTLDKGKKSEPSLEEEEEKQPDTKLPGDGSTLAPSVEEEQQTQSELAMAGTTPVPLVKAEQQPEADIDLSSIPTVDEDKPSESSIELTTGAPSSEEEKQPDSEDSKYETTAAPSIEKEKEPVSDIDMTTLVPSLEGEKQVDVGTTSAPSSEEEKLPESMVDVVTLTPTVEEEKQDEAEEDMTTSAPSAEEEKQTESGIDKTTAVPFADIKTTVSSDEEEEPESGVDKTTAAPFEATDVLPEAEQKQPESGPDMGTTIAPIPDEEAQPEISMDMDTEVKSEEPQIITTLAPSLEAEKQPESTLDMTTRGPTADEDKLPEPAISEAGTTVAPSEEQQKESTATAAPSEEEDLQSQTEVPITPSVGEEQPTESATILPAVDGDKKSEAEEEKQTATKLPGDVTTSAPPVKEEQQTESELGTTPVPLVKTEQQPTVEEEEKLTTDDPSIEGEKLPESISDEVTLAPTVEKEKQPESGEDMITSVPSSEEEKQTESGIDKTTSVPFVEKDTQPDTGATEGPSEDDEKRPEATTTIGVTVDQDGQQAETEKYPDSGYDIATEKQPQLDLATAGTTDVPSMDKQKIPEDEILMGATVPSGEDDTGTTVPTLYSEKKQPESEDSALTTTAAPSIEKQTESGLDIDIEKVTPSAEELPTTDIAEKSKEEAPTDLTSAPEFSKDQTTVSYPEQPIESQTMYPLGAGEIRPTETAPKQPELEEGSTESSDDTEHLIDTTTATDSEQQKYSSEEAAGTTVVPKIDLGPSEKDIQSLGEPTEPSSISGAEESSATMPSELPFAEDKTTKTPSSDEDEQESDIGMAVPTEIPSIEQVDKKPIESMATYTELPQQADDKEGKPHDALETSGEEDGKPEGGLEAQKDDSSEDEELVTEKQPSTKDSSTEVPPKKESEDGNKAETLPPTSDSDKPTQDTEIVTESIEKMSAKPDLGVPTSLLEEEGSGDESFVATSKPIQTDEALEQQTQAPRDEIPEVTAASSDEESAEDSQGSTQAPSVDAKLKPSAEQPTVAPSASSEEESTEGSGEFTPAPPSDEKLKPSAEQATVAPSTTSDEKSTEESGEFTPAPPSDEILKPSAEEQTVAPVVSSEEESTEVSEESTAAPASDEKLKPSAEEQTVAPSATGEEESTEVSEESTAAPASDEKLKPSAEKPTVAPAVSSVEESTEVSEESTAAPPSDEKLKPSAEEPTVAPSASTEEESTEASQEFTPAPVADEKLKPSDEEQTVAPSASIDEESTEESGEFTPAPPSDEKLKPSAEEQTVAPSATSEEESTEESGEFTPAPPSDEKLKPSAEEHTVAPSASSEEESTEASQESTAAPASDEKLKPSAEQPTVAPSAASEEESTVESGEFTPVPPSDEKLKPSAEEQTVAPSAASEEESTEESGEFTPVPPTDEKLKPSAEEPTVAPAVSSEEESTEVSQESTAAPASDEKLKPSAEEQTVAPSATSEEESTEGSGEFTPAPPSDEKLKPSAEEQTVAPSATSEEESTEESGEFTPAPPSDEKLKPSAEQPTVAPSASSEEESTEESGEFTPAPPSDEKLKPSAEEPTVAPAVSSEEAFTEGSQELTSAPPSDEKLKPLDEEQTVAPSASSEEAFTEGSQELTSAPPSDQKLKPLDEEQTVAPSASTEDESADEVPEHAVTTTAPTEESRTAVPELEEEKKDTEPLTKTELEDAGGEEVRVTTLSPTEHEESVPLAATKKPEESTEIPSYTTGVTDVKDTIKTEDDVLTATTMAPSLDGVDQTGTPISKEKPVGETGDEIGEPSGEEMDEGLQTSTSVPFKRIRTTAVPHVSANLESGEEMVESLESEEELADKTGLKDGSETATDVLEGSTTEGVQKANLTTPETVKEEDIVPETMKIDEAVPTRIPESQPEATEKDGIDISYTTMHPLFHPQTFGTVPPSDADKIVDRFGDVEEEKKATEAASTSSTAGTPIVMTTSTMKPSTTAAPVTHYPQAPPLYEQPPNMYEDEYTDEDETEVFGPGTCRYGGKLYVSAQQIPRDDPCDFCFCFRSDIICLQQSCPPPIAGCHEEPISGFCCPRYECPVSMAAVLNITTSTTTTSTTLPPHFLHHSYGDAVQRNGCVINGRTYKVGEKIESTSGPCINCSCGDNGKMKCDPQACVPEPTMQQVMAVVAAGRKR